MVARSGVPHEICPDVAAVVAQKLLVGPPARICAYSGRGPLGGWIRVLAVRVGLDLTRAQKLRGSLEESILPEASPDPELLHARSRYRDQFQAAFAAAVLDLPIRERNLLRLHHLDGLSVDQIGRLYRIHRATAARHVARAREAVLESTRLRLGVGTRELRSLVGLVRSHLVLDVGALLQTP